MSPSGGFSQMIQPVPVQTIYTPLISIALIVGSISSLLMMRLTERLFVRCEYRLGHPPSTVNKIEQREASRPCKRQ